MKYYYSCFFPNSKVCRYYTYMSTIKLIQGELAVVPSPYGCGFSVVEVHERINKKSLTLNADELTQIVCRLKEKVDETKQYNKHYICAVNGNRNNFVNVASPVKLKPGDIIFANTAHKSLLNVMKETDAVVLNEYKLIQKISLKRYEKSIKQEDF